jgi:hypothetical protein
VIGRGLLAAERRAHLVAGGSGTCKGADGRTYGIGRDRAEHEPVAQILDDDAVRPPAIPYLGWDRDLTTCRDRSCLHEEYSIA